MSNTAIKIQDLGKLYRLGEVGTGTLSHDLNRWWHRVRGKEDPYQKIGQSNDRTRKAESDYVWALRDINLEVKKGEVLGIIGRNGAGKSTLLKILSQVTSPTTGRVEVFGRIASLLEVGTGFHPELTGRENIFLNGAILGMRRHEIQKKFDEIVDFAGVEAYIDTPVKRYSSGMYVRLAFAVAAFLEPEILVVDEVLAVGDAEFQKKCLGRMKDVSVNEGRTVLFVSHNLTAVRSLCETGLLLGDGKTKFLGDAHACIKQYEHDCSLFDVNGGDLSSNPPSNAGLSFCGFDASFAAEGTVLDLLFTLEFDEPMTLRNIGIGINNSLGQRITTLQMKNERGAIEMPRGVHRITCQTNLALNPGRYGLDVLIQAGNSADIFIENGSLMFDVEPHSILPSGKVLSPSQGPLQARSKWII
jgi:lipopolysaccharide transport system ATP-binding protein